MLNQHKLVSHMSNTYVVVHIPIYRYANGIVTQSSLFHCKWPSVLVKTLVRCIDIYSELSLRMNHFINDNIVARATLFLLKYYWTVAMMIKPSWKLQLRNLILSIIGLTPWNLVQISKTEKNMGYALLLFLIFA